MQVEKGLLQTGLFKSKNSVISYLLLKLIDEKGAPSGAWQLQEDLIHYGIHCSTSSVGRLLKGLDYKEYTIQKSNQGRILTPAGQAKLAEFKDNIARVQLQNGFQQSLQVQKYDELIDLLLARKALETEAARQAALKGTADDMERLSAAVDEHRKYVLDNLDPTETALTFHAIIAEISHNRFLKTLLDMLIYEEKKIEAVFETLITRERGRIYVAEHADIAEAVINRDASKAANMMESHIQELYDTIANQMIEKNGFLIKI